MTGIDLFLNNFLTPTVLCFFLGAVTCLLRGDLKLPAQAYSAISIYLLLSIGMKGGVELTKPSFNEIAPALGAAVFLGCMIPLIAFFILRRLKFDLDNAAALAAHYGSVSAVTFVTAIGYLEAKDIPYEKFMTVLLVVMEVPALIIALMLVQMLDKKNHVSIKEGLIEAVTGKSVMLLLGGLLVGYISGASGFKTVKSFFVEPLLGVLCLFLLHLGTITIEKAKELRNSGISKKTILLIIPFGIIMPLISGTCALFVAKFVGLSMGGGVLLSVLAASASYIAAPAAVKISIPKANPAIYLSASLAITFPFNLVIGIPLYEMLAQIIFS